MLRKKWRVVYRTKRDRWDHGSLDGQDGYSDHYFWIIAKLYQFMWSRQSPSGDTYYSKIEDILREDFL